MILKTASNSGETPRSQPTLELSEAQRCMLIRDSGLPLDTRNIMGTPGNVFERLFARGGQTSTIFDNSRNLAHLSLKLGPDVEGHTRRLEIEMRREPQNSSIPVPR